MNGVQRGGRANRPARWGQALRPLVLAAATAVLATACSSSGGVNTEAPDRVSAVASPSTSPTPVDEAAAILAAYREFFDRQAEISLAPIDQQRALLSPFTGDPALGSVLRGLKKAAAEDRAGYGTGKLNPRVLKIRGDSATVDDCQNNTEAGEMRASTGKKLTRGTKRDHFRTEMRRGADDRWRVTFVELSDSPC